MVDRLASVNPDNGFPDTASLGAVQVKLADPGGVFAASNVEGALAELYALIQAGGGGGTVTAPGAPTSVSATAGDTAVSVHWNAPSSTGGSPITGYDVQRSLTNVTSDFTTVASVTGLTYNSTGLTNGTPYYFRVIAKNALGAGNPSSIVSATPVPSGGGGPTAPGAPTSLAATPHDASVSLTWAAPGSDGGSSITGYDVQRSLDNNPSNFVTVSSPTGLTYTDSGRTNGTTYFYRVLAKNAIGSGSPSSVASATPATSGGTTPDAPTSVSATPGDTSVTVFWTAPVGVGSSPLTGYKLQQSLSSGSGFTTVQSVGPNGSFAIATLLTNGTTYYFRVIAVNASGDGAPSTAVIGIPVAPVGGTTPSAPLNLTATPVAAGVKLDWTAPSTWNGNPASYNIYISTSPTTGFSIWATIPGPAAPTRTVLPLTAGTTYYFKVSASNLENPTSFSPYSSTVSGLPLAWPALPASWDAAVATNDLTAITVWYKTNTGYDSEGFTAAQLWGPGQADFVNIDDAWLTANAGPNVVQSGGRWTVTGLHAQYISIRRDNVTTSHCKADRPFAMNASGIDVFGTFKGAIVDHCTMAGNFGDSNHDANGDGAAYYNNVDHSIDNMVVRYCEISGYRAGWLMYFGSTAQYNYVHDLYIFSDSHNTAHSIRGENCYITRCLLTDGTSSNVSCYADSDPYTKFFITENIFTTQGNALSEINFPMRPPNNWNLLQNGYDRELVGNIMVEGSAGDLAYFTKTFNNRKLADGAKLFFDTGEPQVAHQPSLVKFRYDDFGSGAPFLNTYEFTPTPNSTLLVLAAPQNAGHITVPIPTVAAAGQYVAGQTFTKIAETATDPPSGDNYALKLFLFQGVTGPTTGFQHITVNFGGTGNPNYYGTFWVFEVTGTTGLTLVKYTPKIEHNPAFLGVLDSITAALASAATAGNLCMAFAAGSSLTSPNAYADVPNWTKIGLQPITIKPGNAPGVVGATYWSKTFTGPSLTIPDLGNGVSPSGLLLCEFSGA